VQDGVYTKEQAAKGMKVYEEFCLICHPIDEYVGIYMEGWEGMTAIALVDSIAETMPVDNPGGLDVQELIDMVTYIFQANGLPAGDAEMDEIAAEQTIVNGPFAEARADSESAQGAKP
jgi:hypothetical protein